MPSSAAWTMVSQVPAEIHNEPVRVEGRRPTFFPCSKLERRERRALMADPHARALAAHLTVRPPLRSSSACLLARADAPPAPALSGSECERHTVCQRANMARSVGHLDTVNTMSSHMTGTPLRLALALQCTLLSTT